MANTRRNDLLLAAAILLAALLLWGGLRLWSGGEGELDAVVTVDGARRAALPLSEDARLEIVSEGGVNLLVIADGAAYIESADCLNQICVHSRPISQEGELIVCLPHKVVVAIERHEGR